MHKMLREVLRKKLIGGFVSFLMALGIRLYDTKNKPTEELEEKAFSHNNNLIDIYSNSWGPGDPGWRVQGPGPASRKALKEGTRSVGVAAFIIRRYFILY